MRAIAVPPLAGQAVIAACTLARFAAGVARVNVVVVLNSGDASVSSLDPTARTELRLFDVGKEPHHLMATPDSDLAATSRCSFLFWSCCSVLPGFAPPSSQPAPATR